MYRYKSFYFYMHTYIYLMYYLRDKDPTLHGLNRTSPFSCVCVSYVFVFVWVGECVWCGFVVWVCCVCVCDVCLSVCLWVCVVWICVDLRSCIQRWTPGHIL